MNIIISITIISMELLLPISRDYNYFCHLQRLCSTKGVNGHCMLEQKNHLKGFAINQSWK